MQGRFRGGGSDAFVARLSADGTALVHATYLGGSGNDTCGGIAVRGGEAFVVGTTSSRDFPVSQGVVQATYGGGASDAFAAALQEDLQYLHYATYLGGPGADRGNAIAVNGDGRAYIAGDTTSRGLPTLGGNPPTNTGAVQRSFSGGASDAFVAEVTFQGDSLFFFTYLGGSGADHARGIALDRDPTTGYFYVTGDTTSRDFPLTRNAAQRHNAGYGDAFVTEFNAWGSALLYSTYLGGSGSEGAHAIAIGYNGHASITGGTDSQNLRTTPGAAQRRYSGGGDAFVAEVSTRGPQILHTTYLGGSGADEGNGIAVDAHGRIYVTGDTRSTDFRTTDNAVQTSAGGGSATGFVTSLTLP